MIYLLWGLLNIGLAIYFIITCFKATKLIHEKNGLLASAIFVCGLLSFVVFSKKNDDNKVRIDNKKETILGRNKTWEFASKDSLKRNSTNWIDIDLEKTIISKFVLCIEYGKVKQGELNVPISAITSTSGFLSGTSWKPISISVNRTTDNNKFEYLVVGFVKWKLLGATLYSQQKEYSGISLLK
jgi:hypothetical protein